MTRDQKVQKEKLIEDALGVKYISIISLTAFLGIGIWMLLDPSGGKHSGYERSSTYLIKELWSFEAGIIITLIAAFFIVKTFMTIGTIKGFSWVRTNSGYYLFKNQTRISGLHSLYDGSDLIVFNPSANEVYKFPKYTKTKGNKFKKVLLDERFNCTDPYWTANQDGYYLFEKGVRVEGLSSEYRGDDLIVSSDQLGKKYRLPNYKSNLDNRIRSASRY